MNLSTIHSKADFIGMLNPKAWMLSILTRPSCFLTHSLNY